MADESSKFRFKDESQTTQEISNPSYDQIVDALLAHTCIVFFKKVTDGTTRRMRCTLDQKHMIGKYKDFRLFKMVVQTWKRNAGFEVTNTYGKNKFKRRVMKEGLLPVWDIEKQNWRSFYVDNVSLMIIDTMEQLP